MAAYSRWPLTTVVAQCSYYCIYNGGTLSEKVKAINVKILDTNMTFARTMALQCSQRNYDTNNMMAHELARQPASMFDDRGPMKVGKTKLFLRLIEKSIWHGDRQKVDGCAILWVVPSLSCETRQTSSTSSIATSRYVESNHINKMFDRCKEGSTN